LVAQAAKLEGAKKLAVFFQNDDYGKGGARGRPPRREGIVGPDSRRRCRTRVADRELGTQALKLKESGAGHRAALLDRPHGAAIVKEDGQGGLPAPRLFALVHAGGPQRDVPVCCGNLWEGAYFNVNEGRARRARSGPCEVDILLKEEPKLKGPRVVCAELGATAMAV